jgi:hypothetical protein
MEPEPEPTSHEEWVDFVRDIFKSMGGDIVPPRRPGHHDIITPARDDFMLDFEYSCLSQHWDSSIRPHPKGSRRYEDPEWAARIQAQVYPNHSDLDWYEYVEWVSQGGGDVWFQEEDECNIDHLFCKKHKSGPLDVWYDCDACVQEVRAGPMPQDGRYELVYTS